MIRGQWLGGGKEVRLIGNYKGNGELDRELDVWASGRSGWVVRGGKVSGEGKCNLGVEVGGGRGSW